MAETRTSRVRETLIERRRETARRKPRTAFVLSGGGNLGAVQVGMLTALIEFDIIPDVVLGCSIGAMNGAAFALDPTAHGLEQLVGTWRDAAAGEVMPSSRIPSVVQMLRRGVALHENAGLRAGIEGMLGQARTFEDLVIPFQCNAVDVESSMTTWFSEGELVPAILASAALPAVYPPVEIDGRTYIDGGVIENVPIGRAVELGCRKIYVLHMGPHGRPAHELKRPMDAALQAYWVARNSQFAKDLASLPDRVEAIVLPPGQRRELKHDDFSQTPALIEQGYENTRRFLERRADEEERRSVSELLGPIERLVLSARSIKWRQHTTNAANDPEGAVVAAGVDRSEEFPDLEEADEETEQSSEVDDPAGEEPASTGRFHRQ